MRRTYHVKTSVKGPSTIRDAYGFEVPQTLAGLYVENSATWSAEEKRRTDKWLQFLKDICPPEHRMKNVIFAGFWDGVLEESFRRVVVEHKADPNGGTELGDRLDALVRLGIPSFLRGYAWSLFLGYDSDKTPGLFRHLSTRANPSTPSRIGAPEVDMNPAPIQKNMRRTFSDATARDLEILKETHSFTNPPFFQCEQTVEQINKDLDRTFPGHPLMDEAGKDALRQILVAFSLHRPDIGYCQGMNFISGLLLLFHQPEDAFWNLLSIIEHLLPNQFDRDMLPAVVDKLVFSHLVQEHFPELAQHLDELSVDVSYLCPHWFLCCFVNALPMETCLRVWDILFWERKPSVLFKIALALVDFYSKDLMETKNAAVAWEQLQNMAASFFSSSRLIETACLKFEDVDEAHIDELRSRFLDRIKEQSIKDLLGRGSHFGHDDVSAATTPTKILAASASLVRNESEVSTTSVSSSDVTKSEQELIGSLRGDANRRVAHDVVALLHDCDGVIPEELSTRIHDLIDRLAETEAEGREAKLQVEVSRKDIAKANESNRSLKSRLGAVYTDLDKKNECLDRMIAKCQILTEKVASQEEVICQQKKLLHEKEAASPTGGNRGSNSSKIASGVERGTQSLKNLFTLRR